MKKKPKNPTPDPLLKIGDRVLVRARVAFTTDRDWDANYQPVGPIKRVMDRTEWLYPIEMIVVGATRRQLGIVQKSSGYDEDYTPGCLKVTETVFVYQCRVSLMRKIIQVLPTDLEQVK